MVQQDIQAGIKTQSLSFDRINDLPSAITENILCRVPIEEAVRTSILSREWRYIWTKIPKLEFDENAYEVSKDDANQMPNPDQTFKKRQRKRKKMSKRCKFFYAIYQVLLLHQGPLVEFTLAMKSNSIFDYCLDCVEIDQIILHLSRKNTVKKLHLSCFYTLPSTVFSLDQLTDLYLQSCNIPRQPTFCGFGSLRSLYLDNVDVSKKVLMHILSNNPLLKSFGMVKGTNNFYNNIDEDSTVNEIFECLPMIEHLAIRASDIKCFVEGVVPRELPNSLVHLKCFCLEAICVMDKYVLPFLVFLIRSSPNLEKLRLQILRKNLNHYWIDEIYSVTLALQDYSDIWLNHLIELEIENTGDLIPELEFVKLILVKSPVLNKVNILLGNGVTNDEESVIIRNLLSSPHASPTLEIVAGRF